VRQAQRGRTLSLSANRVGDTHSGASSFLDTPYYRWCILLPTCLWLARPLTTQSMSDYRRYFVAGGTYFFTVVIWRRRRILTTPLARRCLRAAIETVRRTRLFEIPAVVLLPDHLHAIWVLPSGDADYTTRWRRIKEEFTRLYLSGGGAELDRTSSRRSRGERDVWQRRFWEHLVEDESDVERHFDYVHYNPVKHRLARCPGDWRWSSFGRWRDRGVYGSNWGCSADGPLDFSDIEHTAME
jgi:putative transposase